MVSDAIKVEVDPGQVLQKQLRKAVESVQDLRLPLNLISQQWFKSNYAIFSLKGPGKYPPFKHAIRAARLSVNGKRGREFDVEKSPYQLRKLREVGFDYPLLAKSFDLARSITDPNDPQSVNYLINKVSMALGTAVPYAIYHQSKAPRTKMPYRPMILFGNEQVAPNALSNRVAGWVRLIQDYVKQVSGVKRG